MPDYVVQKSTQRVSPIALGLKDRERIAAQKEVFRMEKKVDKNRGGYKNSHSPKVQDPGKLLP